jgi:hypothetical protein
MNSSSEQNELTKYFFEVDVKHFLSITNSATYSGSSFKIFILIQQIPFWCIVRLATGLCNWSLFFIVIPRTVQLNIKFPGYVTKISLRIVCTAKLMSVSAMTEIVVCK